MLNDEIGKKNQLKKGKKTITRITLVNLPNS